MDLKGFGDSKRIEGADDVLMVSEESFFYTKVENRRPAAVRYHNFLTGASEEIYREADPEKHLSIRLSKDKSYLIISSNSHSESTLTFLKVYDQDRKVVSSYNLIKLSNHSSSQGKSKLFIDHF